MVITRTPFRISFFGGGTDYPVWYEENGGAVLSVTINKYCYLSCRYLPPFFEHKSRIVWSKIESVRDLDEIQHPSAREVLKYLNMNKGVEVHHDGDIPARSGLGASSSFTVGLLNAMYALKGEITTKRQLALDAIHIEQERLKENVGCQDQAAAAFGGLNRIEFGGPHKIVIHPVALSADKIQNLENHMMIFFTGLARNASEVAAEQVKNTPNKTAELRTMMALVQEAMNVLNKENFIDDFGKLLHESWRLKRSLSSQITNSTVDQIYETGLAAGALGGKLLGAGGGGFILFLVPPDKRNFLKEKLGNLLHVPFKFENIGSQIVYYAPENSIHE